MAIELQMAMNRLKTWVRDALGFSGREINGFLILLPLMLICILVVPAYKAWMVNRTDDFTADFRALDSLIANWPQPEKETVPQVAIARFHFNPNTATEEELNSLGFPTALSKRITNYRQKGGVFRTKRDLLKIYGLDSSFYTQLQAYIRLPDEITYQRRSDKHIFSKPASYGITTFDLNAADTSQLKSVRGIGPVLAARILKFRDGLGGFIDPRQVYEVYGLDSATVDKLWKAAFIADNFTPRQMNLNEAGENELSSHPYIRRNAARGIVAYRLQHGKFADVEELRKLTNLQSSDIERILPYITVEEN